MSTSSQRPGRKSLPDRWLDYCNVGSRIPGTPFVAFKVPLNENVCRNLPLEQRFFPDMLMDLLPSLSMIVDLTATHKYYNPEIFRRRGIHHEKLLCAGHVVPSNSLINRFFNAVDEFLSKCDSTRVVGVHCTHGLNRTGFFVCSYMIQKLGFNANDAISMFNDARGHPIERDNYLQTLRSLLPNPLPPKRVEILEIRPESLRYSNGPTGPYDRSADYCWNVGDRNCRSNLDYYDNSFRTRGRDRKFREERCFEYSGNYGDWRIRNGERQNGRNAGYEHFQSSSKYRIDRRSQFRDRLEDPNRCRYSNKSRDTDRSWSIDRSIDNDPNWGAYESRHADTNRVTYPRSPDRNRDADNSRHADRNRQTYTNRDADKSRLTGQSRGTDPNADAYPRRADLNRDTDKSSYTDRSRHSDTNMSIDPNGNADLKSTGLTNDNAVSDRKGDTFRKVL